MTEGLFEILFTEDGCNSNYCTGSISLCGTVETFSSSLSSFAKDAYENHWKSSAQKSVIQRQTTALFTDVSLDPDGTGWLWLYTLIPSEEVNDKEFSNTGIFITQRFFPVCTKPKNFLTRKFVEYDDGTTGEELSLYFLDLDHPERFFGYLDTNILGISHWFVTNHNMKDFIGVE